jgi:ribonuclease BN (tRNA processing enzyme)
VQVAKSIPSSIAAILLVVTSAQAAQEAPPATAAQRAQADGITLLGTGGGPGGRIDRAGIATLLQVDGQAYLVDAGEGVARQLARAGISERAIDRVFLTHLHDDHFAGLLALATFAFTQRSPRLQVVGPVGTQQLASGVVSVMDASARIRMAEGPFPGPPNAFLKAEEFGAGPVYQDANVRVTAIENTHFRLAPETAARNKSYSLRFDFGGKSVVFSGDTGPSAALEGLARGADILVAEMVSADDRRSVPPSVLKHMDEEHLSPTEVGKLAQRAGVKMLVLSHVGRVERAEVEEVRRNFSGQVVLGVDLMKLAI